MRYLTVLCIVLLGLGGVLNGLTVVRGQETDTPTPVGTESETPSPTPEITATPTVTPTPDFAYVWTLSSGQSAEIVFSMTAGDVIVAVLLFILIGLSAFGLFLMLTKK